MGPVGACPHSGAADARRANKTGKVRLRISFLVGFLVMGDGLRLSVSNSTQRQGQTLPQESAIPRMEVRSFGETDYVPRARQAEAPARTESTAPRSAIPGKHGRPAYTHSGRIPAPAGATEE